ncbi:MAG: hypothetical protein AAGE96_15865 [Cyanobacteria bacterium P01_G01_bin.19]
MKLFLHIGTEKTGSTTIQEALFVNKECLQKQGFYFVQSAGKKNNRKIPAYCMRDDKYDGFFKAQRITTLHQKNIFRKEFFDSFKAEIMNLPKHVHTVIISSEHFHSRTTTIEEVENVKSLLGSFFEDIKIICYVREQSATAVSSYSTAIKSGGTPSLKEILSKCKPGNIYYNYYLMLSNWRNIFGADNLIVRKFDKSILKNNDLIDDFFCLIDDVLIKSISKDISLKNESLNMIGQFLGRSVNQAIPIYYDTGLLNPIRDQAISKICQSFNGRGQTCNKNDYDKIYTSFEASNIKLNEEFLGGLEGVNCFDRNPPQEAYDKTFLEESDIPKLADVFKVFSSNSLGLPHHYADFFRDLATSLEKTDLVSAHKLMELAHLLKPNAPHIKRKLNEYNKKLKLGQDTND